MKTTNSEQVSVSWIEVTIDCHDPDRLSTFWGDLLGVAKMPTPLPGWVRLDSTVPGGPVLNFQPVREAKVEKSRIHLDLFTDDLKATMSWIKDHGGRFTDEVHVYEEGTVVVMADPEGTEFCVVAPPGSTISD
jgi:predicted enzyme related to lactoylglutathione lyase